MAKPKRSFLGPGLVVVLPLFMVLVLLAVFPKGRPRELKFANPAPAEKAPVRSTTSSPPPPPATPPESPKPSAFPPSQGTKPEGSATQRKPAILPPQHTSEADNAQPSVQSPFLTPPPQRAPITQQTQPSFALELSASGTQIEAGQTYRQDDPRFVDGTNLILSVAYQGAVPSQTELTVEWYVGPKPVSFFPTLKVPNRAGRWSRAYDNRTVEPGEHKIQLKVNGQDGPTLAFTVEASAKRK